MNQAYQITGGFAGEGKEIVHVLRREPASGSRWCYALIVVSASRMALRMGSQSYEKVASQLGQHLV